MFENLAIIGLILFLAVIGGRVAAFFKLPMVTGYILIGIILGRSYLGIIDSQVSGELQILADIAIGFIIFSIGGIFHLPRLRKRWKKMLALSLSESFMTFGLVFIFCLIYSFFLPLNFMAVVFISIIAISTAPAATVMVLREYDSEGPVTDYLYSLLGVNNFISIFLFSVASMIFLIFTHGEVQTTFEWMPVYLQPLWMILGSIAAGIALGFILAYLEHYEKDSNQILIYVLAAILISIVAAEKYDLSFLIICLFMGITVINVTSKSESMFEILKNSDPPLYAIFFVLAGAKFDINIIGGIGVLGIGYLFVRAGGKMLGIFLAARKINEQDAVKKYLGLALLPQAGLAISIATIVANEYGEMGGSILTLVIATSIIYETLGPIFTKVSVFRAGEVKASFLININSISNFGAKSKSFLHHLSNRAYLLLGLKEVSRARKVKDEMITEMDILREKTPYKMIVNFLQRAPYNYLPVVDSEHRYAGVVTSETVKGLVLNSDLNRLILARDVADRNLVPVVYPDDLLIETFDKFGGKFISYLVVLDNQSAQKVVGILDKTDVIAICGRIREKKENQ